MRSSVTYFHIIILYYFTTWADGICFRTQNMLTVWTVFKFMLKKEQNGFCFFSFWQQNWTCCSNTFGWDYINNLSLEKILLLKKKHFSLNLFFFFLMQWVNSKAHRVHLTFFSSAQDCAEDFTVEGWNQNWNKTQIICLQMWRHIPVMYVHPYLCQSAQLLILDIERYDEYSWSLYSIFTLQSK